MDRPLHVLVIGVSWPMETFLQRLVEGLLARGIHLTVAAGRRPELYWLAQPGFTWLPVPGWKGANSRSLFTMVLQAMRSAITRREDLQRIAPSLPAVNNLSAWLPAWQRLLPFVGRRWDVVYFPWNSGAISHLPLFNLGMPVVLSCRGSQVNIAPHNPRRGDIRAGLRATLEHAARVHCVSQDILKEAQAWGLDPTKARVIYPAVNPDFFVPVTQPTMHNRTFRIVTTGSLTWVKGLEYALLAVRRLKDAGIPVQYEIIGDGPDRSRVLYTLQDLSLQQNVTLSGKLPPEMVRLRLQQSEAFLLASLSEGISNAVLEAMACGLPVVTSDCGGMREAVSDGVEGFVTPVRDPEAMAMALSRLCQAPDLRQRMGQAGRQKVLQQHHQDMQISSFVKLFQEAVNHG